MAHPGPMRTEVGSALPLPLPRPSSPWIAGDGVLPVLRAEGWTGSNWKMRGPNTNKTAHPSGKETERGGTNGSGGTT